MDAPLTIDISGLMKEELKRFIFVDLREPIEVFLRPMKEFDCLKLPLSQYSQSKFRFEQSRKYILFCAKGIRSLSLAQQLHSQGITNVTSLIGGIDTKNYQSA